MGLFDFLDPIKLAIENLLIDKGLTVSPWNVVVLVILSVGASALSGFVSKKLIDMDELNTQNRKIQLHNQRKKKARETADRKLWLSVEKKEKQIQDIQRSMMTKRMLPSFITIGPMIFIFSTLRQAFQSHANLLLNGNSHLNNGTCTNSCGVVAVLPFHVPKWFPLIGKWFSPFVSNPDLSVAGFGFFYFLTALTTSTLIQKIFGINLTGMQQNPGMGMN